MSQSKMTHVVHFFYVATVILLVIVVWYKSSVGSATNIYLRRALLQNDEGVKVGAACEDLSQILVSCIPSVLGPNPSAPSSQCCKIFSTLDKSCLCTLLSAPTKGLKISIPAAKALPDRCEMPNPKDFSCKK
ncbi:hypothetical protein Mapa_014901 [Marchantia paleacea]|nr:hypothetical protein Mapa_014901 [Marchantia paleacea]